MGETTWGAERIGRLGRLRAKGLSFPEIAREMGCSEQYARRVHVREFAGKTGHLEKAYPPLTEGQAAVVASALQDVERCVHYWRARWPSLRRCEADDLVQQALLWVCRGAGRFDPGKGGWKTWLSWRVKGAMALALRQSRRRCVSLAADVPAPLSHCWSVGAAADAA